MSIGLVLEIAMADHIAVIIEAIRRTQAKVAYYLEPGRDQRQGLQEIGAIVEDQQLLLVLELLRLKIKSRPWFQMNQPRTSPLHHRYRVNVSYSALTA